jgi:hypothetical protein
LIKVSRRSRYSRHSRRSSTSTSSESSRSSSSRSSRSSQSSRPLGRAGLSTDSRPGAPRRGRVRSSAAVDARHGVGPTARAALLAVRVDGDAPPLGRGRRASGPRAARGPRRGAGGARVGRCKIRLGRRRGVRGGSHALGESRGVVGRRPRRRGGRGGWSCKLAYLHCQLLYIHINKFVALMCERVWCGCVLHHECAQLN